MFQLGASIRVLTCKSTTEGLFDEDRGSKSSQATGFVVVGDAIANAFCFGTESESLSK
jgi:hypothetical protein